jgi:hypothetical protein
MTTTEHNAAEHLTVRWQDYHTKRPGGSPGHELAGWVVVRVCPCHWGEPVSLPFDDRARAERVRQLLLGEVSGPSGPKLTWVSPPPRPALAAGQVWRDRARGELRYIRIVSVEALRVLAHTVVRDASGVWVVPPPGRGRVAGRVGAISQKRFARGYFYFIEGSDDDLLRQGERARVLDE